MKEDLQLAADMLTDDITGDPGLLHRGLYDYIVSVSEKMNFGRPARKLKQRDIAIIVTTWQQINPYAKAYGD